MTATLLKLIALFAALSLLAVGGGNAVIPAMQHAAVDVQHWMTDREFLELFAIARLAPGPGSLVVTLIGQKAAGVLGAVVATSAMYAPSCLVVYGAAHAWHRYRDARWRETVERGLAPLAVGLVFASAITLMRGTEHAASAIVLTLIATVILTATELHPLLILIAGGAIGAALHL